MHMRRYVDTLVSLLVCQYLCILHIGHGGLRMLSGVKEYEMPLNWGFSRVWSQLVARCNSHLLSGTLCGLGNLIDNPQEDLPDPPHQLEVDSGQTADRYRQQVGADSRTPAVRSDAQKELPGSNSRSLSSGGTPASYWLQH